MSARDDIDQLRRGLEGVELTYSVREVGAPSPLEMAFENEAFSAAIGRGEAVFRFKEAIPSFHEGQPFFEAMQRVEEFLASWEGELLLQTASVRRVFEIVRSYAPTVGYEGAYLRGHISLAAAAAEAEERRYWPWRQHRYRDQDLVASLVRTYERYRDGKERLSVLCYLCYTAIGAQLSEKKDKRAQISRWLCVDHGVLSRLTDLAGTVGTIETGRKLVVETQRDFTTEEIFWLERTTHELIRRFGEARAGRPLKRLAMTDLPPL